jgi:hypothetical protein
MPDRIGIGPPPDENTKETAAGDRMKSQKTRDLWIGAAALLVIAAASA